MPAQQKNNPPIKNIYFQRLGSPLSLQIDALQKYVMPKKQYPFLSASGCFKLRALASCSGWCWCSPQPPGPALLEATLPSRQGQGTGFGKENPLRLRSPLVLPHQCWFCWTCISCSPAFLPAPCTPLEKLLIAPSAILLSFPTSSPHTGQGGKHPACAWPWMKDWGSLSNASSPTPSFLPAVCLPFACCHERRTAPATVDRAALSQDML